MIYMEKTYTTRWGTFVVDTERDKKIATLFERGAYQDDKEMEWLTQFADLAGTVCDVGAHIGTTAIPYAQQAKKVHAFEPMPQSAETLARNIQLNGLTNIVIHQVGLSDEDGVMRADVRSSSSAATAMLSDHGSVEVPITTLDAVLDGEPCSFIKIDVEGMEPAVLRGSAHTLARHHPALFFDVNLARLREHGYSVKDITSQLKNLGYSFYLPRGSTLYPLWSLSYATMMLVPREWFFRTGASGVFNVFAVAHAEVPLAESKSRFAIRQIIELGGRTISRVKF